MSPSRVPILPPSLPRRSSRALRAAGRIGLGLLGWRFEGAIPDVPKLVIILAPHTSNWDFFVGLFADLALALDASWLGKDSIFVGMIGTVLRRLGGIPVDRAHPHDVVARVVAEFHRRDRMVIGLAPEGTRHRVAEWRSGFWHIARGAQVPILPVGLDFGRRALRIGPPYAPTDSLEADLRTLKAFFADVVPKRLDRVS
jgi:1-acyl-sn-glycerol-3-phosphate acyltransferase